jgi:hypothetical protein
MTIVSYASIKLHSFFEENSFTRFHNQPAT